MLCFALENTKKKSVIEFEERERGVVWMGVGVGGDRGRQEKTEEIIINNNDFSLITFFFSLSLSKENKEQKICYKESIDSRGRRSIINIYIKLNLADLTQN